MPFWLRANQFGSIPLDNASLSLLGSARKDYDTAKTVIFDWGASFEGRMNVGNDTNFILVEGYGKMRIGIFEIQGRSCQRDHGSLRQEFVFRIFFGFGKCPGNSQSAD